MHKLLQRQKHLANRNHYIAKLPLHPLITTIPSSSTHTHPQVPNHHCAHIQGLSAQISGVSSAATSLEVVEVLYGTQEGIDMLGSPVQTSKQLMRR
jgi:hypothetical protein